MALGTKLLEGWLSNRRQTLVPHTLNFRALSPDEAADIGWRNACRIYGVEAP